MSLDPRHAPGVGTPVPGGLTFREAHLACEVVAETGKLIGMDMVEVNPILDVQNQTAILGGGIYPLGAGFADLEWVSVERIGNPLIAGYHLAP